MKIRYEISLLIRVVAAITLMLIPFNIFQTYLTDVTFNTILWFLEWSHASPTVGVYQVSHAITILGGQVTLNVVKYCVTSSAYYLLTILALITFGIPLWKRIALYLIGAGLIFMMNVARIVFLLVVLIESKEAFEPLHSLAGMLLATVFVIFIWFLLSLLFRIKSIPIFTDIQILIKEVFTKNEIRK